MLLLSHRTIRGEIACALTLSAVTAAVLIGPPAQAEPSGTSLSQRPATIAPVAQPLVHAFTVRISGTRAIGHVLTATVSPKPAAGSTVHYAWLRHGAALSGGGSARRTILLTDTGAALAVRVTVTEPGHASRTVTASAGSIARPALKRASAASVKKGHLPSGTRVWYTTGAKQRWIQTSIPGHAATIFLLKGARLRAYLHTGAIATHGVPVSTKCGLPGRGCLTHYTHGTIYTAPHGVVGTTTVQGARGDMIAVAASQIGYHERLGYYALHNTKYNEFVHSSHAWCSFVQSWAAYYSGHKEVAPPYPTFTRFRKHLTTTGKKLSKPKVGAFVLLSVTETYSHCALISAVSKDKRSFKIIEGNWGGKVGTRWLTVGGYNSPEQFWYPSGY